MSSDTLIYHICWWDDRRKPVFLRVLRYYEILCRLDELLSALAAIYSYNNYVKLWQLEYKKDEYGTYCRLRNKTECNQNSFVRNEEINKWDCFYIGRLYWKILPESFKVTCDHLHILHQCS